MYVVSSTRFLSASPAHTHVKYKKLHCKQKQVKNSPILPQHQDPQWGQSFNATHFQDLIVVQVQEHELLQIRQMLDPGD